MLSVKICGLSEESTLHTAVESGANLIGFVHFSKSPRHVSLARAAELKALLPASVASVLVVVNPDDALLAEIAAILAPDYLQLHGDESPERIAAIRKQYPAQKFIKALAISSRADLTPVRAYEPHVDILLFDAKPPYFSPHRGETERGASTVQPEALEQASPHPNPPPTGEGHYLPGGNGIAFDWSILQGFKTHLPWMLSGGLTPENVAEAIRESHAQMVDVSSGVEAKAGVKDAGKITRFILAARS